MTVLNQTKKVTANGNDVATVFSFSPIVLFEPDTGEDHDLEVTIRDSLGVETVISEGTGATNYSVTVASFPGTGSITYPASGGTPLATGSTITMKRVLVLEQETRFRNQGGYNPKNLENVLDRGIMIDLQLLEELERVLKAAVTDTAVDLTLPSATARALTFLGFDATGAPIATLGTPGTVPVSTFMETLLDDTSAAAGRATLGSTVVGDALYIAASAAAARTTLDTFEDVFTTRGDILTAGVAGAEQRLALGTSGQALVSDGTDAIWGSALVLPAGYIGEVTITTADPDATLTVNQVRADDDTDNMVLATALTKGIGGTWVVGNNQNGLDTGTVQASSTYFIWRIKRSDTGVVDWLFSLSSTSPTLPTNYDLKQVVGAVFTDGSSNIITDRITTLSHIPGASRFKTEEFTVTAGDDAQIAHGLRKEPLGFRAYLLCNTAEDNWVIGDRIELGAGRASTSTRGMTFGWDGTNGDVEFDYVQGSDAATFEVQNKTTGASAPLTNGNFGLFMEVWA